MSPSLVHREELHDTARGDREHVEIPGDPNGVVAIDGDPRLARQMDGRSKRAGWRRAGIIEATRRRPGDPPDSSRLDQGARRMHHCQDCSSP